MGSFKGGAHLVEGGAVVGVVAEHGVDEVAELAGGAYGAAVAVGDGSALYGAGRVVGVADGSPAGGGDEERGAERVDVGFAGGFGLAGGEDAVGDLGCFVVDEAAAVREVVRGGYGAASGEGEVDEVGSAGW